MGAVTVALRARQVLGGVARSCIADVTFSGTYAAGGDTYTPSQFGMTTILAMVPMGSASGSATTAYVVSPDLANNKIKLMASAAAASPPTETATAGQTGTVARVLVIGDFPYV
jgi:hypothetical protein